MTFTCPKCGGHSFGSIGPSDNMTRHCNNFCDTARALVGGATASCRFTFHMNYDYRYFTKVVEFESKAEHDAYIESLPKRVAKVAFSTVEVRDR